MLRMTVQLLKSQRCRPGATAYVQQASSFPQSNAQNAEDVEESQLHSSQSTHDRASNQDVDLNYRSPTEKVWPASPRQQKVGSRVLRALEMTMSEPKYMQTLIKQYGLCLEEVRMSPDMLVAYVLWSAHPEYEERTQQELQTQLSPIRMSLGRALKARNVPRLEFRLNELSAAQVAVEREFERLARNKAE